MINEILFNPPGTDNPNEYIELRGTPGATIPNGTYFVGIEGDSSSNPGDIQNIFDLSGRAFGSNGILVLLQKGNNYSVQSGANVLTNAGTGAGWGSGTSSSIGHSGDGGATDIENASASFLLIQTGFTPSLIDDIDSDNNGTPDGAVYSGWTVLDSVAILDGGATDIGYGSIVFRNSTSGGLIQSGATVVNTSFAAGYVGRLGSSTGSTASDWIASLIQGTAPNLTLGTGTNTTPGTFAGKALDNIGSTNFTPPNTAPILDNTGTPTLTAIDEDPTSNIGTLVSAIIASGAGGSPIITDVDTGAVKGIAITVVDNTNGIWQYSIDSGSSWSNFSVSSTSAVLLRDTASDRIRFVPNANYNGTANITFRAWDAFDGKASGTTGVNPGAGGGTTAFSTAEESTSITVNAVNDRPTFSIGGNQSVKAGTGKQTITAWAYGFNPGADNESGQKVAEYIVEVINNSGVVQGTPIINLAGDLIYTPASTIGTAEFRVKVRDDGGTANGGFDTSISTTQTFKITVNPTATNSTNGTSGIDNLVGTDQSDRISALNGDDTVFGGLGSDRIFGGNGNDTLYGDLETIPAYGVTFSMNDTIAGGSGNDLIYGNAGNDKLYGDDGKDSIGGGDGDDEIWGGYGDDTLYGGAGKDTFVLVRGQGLDIIQDFESQDVLGCAGSLRYSFLDFQKQGSDTLIIDKVTKQHLATLIGFTDTPNDGGLF